MINEILTFQIGNYSNYICTNFWNLQESQFVYSCDYYGSSQKQQVIPDVNHDCLFREGLNKQNQLTFTPRTVLVDLKENVNVLRSAYKLKSDQEIKDEVVKKTERLEVYESEKYESSSYLNDLDQSEKAGPTKSGNNLANYELDDQVKYWSDFLKLKFHDRSYSLVGPHLINVPPPSEEGEVNEPFGSFANGLSAAKDQDFADSIDESLRHFGEECNNIQGFQLFVDPYNGFGGVSANTIDIINDEYPKKTVLAFLSLPYFANKSSQAKLNRIINTSLTIKSLLYDNKNLVCVPLSMFNSPLTLQPTNDYDPIKLSSIDYNYKLDYHTSGILASLVDCLTSPYRQKSQINYMNELVELFDFKSYKIASLQATYPLDLNEKYLLNHLQESRGLCQESAWFTPYSRQLEDMDTKQSEGAFEVCCKGVVDDRVKNIRDTFAFKPIEKAQVILDFYFNETYPKSRSICHSTTTPLNASSPFPNIFLSNPNVSPLPGKQTPKRSLKDLKNVSLLTILQQNQTSLGLIDLFNAHIKKSNLVSDFRKSTEGLDHDDLIELVEFNKELADMYSTSS